MKPHEEPPHKQPPPSNEQWVDNSKYEWLSLEDAARALGVSSKTVRRRFLDGKMEGKREESGKIWVTLNPREGLPEGWLPATVGKDASGRVTVVPLRDVLPDEDEAITPIRTAPDKELISQLRAEIKDLREQLSVKDGQIALLIQRVPIAALNAGREPRWYQFWRR